MKSVIESAAIVRTNFLQFLFSQIFTYKIVLSTENFPEYRVPGVQHDDFSPYESNGGSIVAIAGDDFVVIAADSRLSSGYSIHTRTQNKLFQRSPQTVLGSPGCWCDTLALTALAKARMTMYKHTHQNKRMTTDAIAQMLSILMYNKHFFPYYVSNVLGGLDKDGKGVVFSNDPIGHCESTTYRAGGSSVLDNQIGLKNMELSESEKPVITKERAVAVVVDTFISTAERDIYTGDAVYINTITNDGVEVKEVPLRQD